MNRRGFIGRLLALAGAPAAVAAAPKVAVAEAAVAPAKFRAADAVLTEIRVNGNAVWAQTSWTTCCTVGEICTASERAGAYEGIDRGENDWWRHE